MALTGTSTLNDVVTEYLANADYDVSASATKAKLFLVACRFLLILLPSRASSGGASELEFDPNTIKGEMNAAKSWINANSGGGVVHPDFRSFQE